MKAEGNIKGPKDQKSESSCSAKQQQLFVHRSLYDITPLCPPAPSTLVTETPFTSQDLEGLKWLAAFSHSALDLN